MNTFDLLKQIGFSINPFIFDRLANAEFRFNEPVTRSSELLFSYKYSKIPSTITIDYKSSSYHDLLKFLHEQNFDVAFIKEQLGLINNDKIFFINRHNQCFVELSDSNMFLAKFPDFSEVNVDSDSSNNSVITIYYSSNCEESRKFVTTLQEKFLNKELLNKIGSKVLLFEKDQFGDLFLSPHTINPFDIDLKTHYNDDFQEVDVKIKAWMNDFTKNNNKLVLLHGVAGSGKTNYIKHLLNSEVNVKKIYIPPYFVQSMSDPAFFPIIRNEKQSILIIEDAEKVLVSREENSDNGVISILLNLCDGIMADVLNFKIIATFNTDENAIDSALKRKGRMFLKYKFDKLSKSKTKKLYNDLYNIDPPESTMSLAEIYNAENEFGAKKEEKKMGFA